MTFTVALVVLPVTSTVPTGDKLGNRKVSLVLRQSVAVARSESRMSVKGGCHVDVTLAASHVNSFPNSPLKMRIVVDHCRLSVSSDFKINLAITTPAVRRGRRRR